MSGALFIAALVGKHAILKAEAEADETPYDPTYVNHCWNCGAYIDDLICQNGGLDEDGCPNGYECEECGKHLGDARESGVEV